MTREQAYRAARRWGFGPFPFGDGRPSSEDQRDAIIRRLDNVLLPAALTAETADAFAELMDLREFYSGCSLRVPAGMITEGEM